MPLAEFPVTERLLAGLLVVARWCDTGVLAFACIKASAVSGVCPNLAKQLT
ncbi:MAG: hypothetical protein ACJASV_001771 [Pseudorhodobacter sp.]